MACGEVLLTKALAGSILCDSVIFTLTLRPHRPQGLLGTGTQVHIRFHIAPELWHSVTDTSCAFHIEMKRSAMEAEERFTITGREEEEKRGKKKHPLEEKE